MPETNMYEPINLKLSRGPLKISPKIPDSFKLEDFSVLAEKFEQDYSDLRIGLIEQCKVDKNDVNSEFLEGFLKTLNSEVKTNPDTLVKINKYYGLSSQKVGTDLLLKLMANPKIRTVICNPKNGNKLESVLNELNKSIGIIEEPKSTTELKNKPTVKKQPGTEKKELEYNKNLKSIGDQLEKSLGISPGLVTRIIEQESLFGTLKMNEGRSTGIMQLNSDPFRNMMQENQCGKYKEYFLNIPSDIIDKISPDGAKNIIKNIISEYSEDKFDKKNLSNLFSQLHTFARLMTNSKDYDVLNMVCGSITLAFCENEKVYKHNSKGEKIGLKNIKLSEVNNFTTENAVKNLINHKGYVLNDGDKKNVDTILKDIKAELNKSGENQTKIDYLTAREYNGSSTKNSYAMNVLIAKRFNQIN